MNAPTGPAITMDASGRLVLPKALRERLNLREATRLRAEVVGGRLELTPIIEDNAELVEIDGFLVARRKPGTRPSRGTSIVEAIAADREERDEALAAAVRGERRR